jgi:hypothetical protein
MLARRFLVYLACLVLACGPADQPEPGIASDSAVSDADMAEASRIIDSTLTQMKRTEAATFPCSLFSAQDVAQITGTPADSGAYTFVNRSEDDREWKSESCTWSGSNEQDTDVDIWVSQPQHFPSGQVICHPLIGGKEITGMGRAAWWTFMTGYGIGTLRVCTDKVLLEVQISRPNGEEEGVLRTAREVAERITASL